MMKFGMKVVKVSRVDLFQHTFGSFLFWARDIIWNSIHYPLTRIMADNILYPVKRAGTNLVAPTIPWFAIWY